MGNAFAIISDGYIICIGHGNIGTKITESKYNTIMQKIQSKPSAPSSYAYKLQADNLEWELVELPPVEPEPPTVEDKAEAYDILMGEEETE